MAITAPVQLPGSSQWCFFHIYKSQHRTKRPVSKDRQARLSTPNQGNLILFIFIDNFNNYFSIIKVKSTGSASQPIISIQLFICARNSLEMQYLVCRDTLVATRHYSNHQMGLVHTPQPPPPPAPPALYGSHPAPWGSSAPPTSPASLVTANSWL